MIPSKTLIQVLCLALCVAGVDVQSQVLTRGGVAPPNKIPSEQWIEKVVGAPMQGARGVGVVVGALCSPANRFTQYWIRKASGERFWATLTDLKSLP